MRFHFKDNIMKKKEFTDKELAEITELVSKMPIHEAARHFNITETLFLSMKSKMPKLQEAISAGIKSRPSNYNSIRKKELKKNAPEKPYKEITENTLNKSVEVEISPEDALKKFKEEFEANKLKRSLEELKNMDIL
jgi:hypothetical protein